jgi:hypothetical protein
MARRRITLLIEDNPTTRGNPHGKIRQLEVRCLIDHRVDPVNPEHGEVYNYIVRQVRDVNTKEIILDTAELPPISVIIEAAQLYNWCHLNKRVFTDGLPMVDGHLFFST